MDILIDASFRYTQFARQLTRTSCGSEFNECIDPQNFINEFHCRHSDLIQIFHYAFMSEKLFYRSSKMIFFNGVINGKRCLKLKGSNTREEEGELEF